MEDRKIEILSREQINALSDEERAARREKIAKVTAYEAHDIVKHFAEMGYNHFRANTRAAAGQPHGKAGSMKKRKAFYSTMRENGVVRISKQDGFEIEVDGEKLNAYVSEERERAYIIDPKTGLALQIYDYYDEELLLSEIEVIEKAKEELLKDKERLLKWREKRSRESYKLTVQTFNAYKRAEKLREKAKEAEQREREQ